MKKSWFGALALAGALLLFTSVARAQDGPTIEADPASVDAPGEVEVTVTGSGFTTDGFLLSCPGLGGAVDGELSPDGSECDLAALTPYTVDDSGGWTATASFTIPEEGLVLVAGDADQTESARTLVSVGAGEEPDEGAEEPDEGGEAPSTEEGTEELANTGAESSLLTIAAATAILAGLLLMSSHRRVGA